MTSSTIVRNRIWDNIIKIALTVIILLWASVDARLRRMEERIRSLEIKTAAIVTKLGIDQPSGLYTHQDAQNAAGLKMSDH